MTTNELTRDLSYFKLSLQSFLNESFPELSSDQTFIQTKAEQAASVYEESILNGLNHIEANEKANNILYQTLAFSKHDLIKDVLWTEFSDRIDEDNVKEIAIKILPECKEIFDSYSFTENFEATSQFNNLYTEIVGQISIMFEENRI